MRRLILALAGMAALTLGGGTAAQTQASTEAPTEQPPPAKPGSTPPAAADTAPPEGQGRIVGGRPATAQDAPWQVEIFFPGQLDANGGPRPEWDRRHKCGGAWLGDDWVITAGHCAFWVPRGAEAGVFAASFLPNRRVRLGTLRLSEGGATRGIRFVVLHSGYGGPGGASNQDHDLALIKLAGPAPDEPARIRVPLKAVALPPPGFAVTPNLPMLVTGWGRDTPLLTQLARKQARDKGIPEPAERARPDGLKALDVFADDEAECRAFAATANAVVTNSICATAGPDEAGKLQDQCNGDSGGPLTHKTRVRGGLATYLLGLVSWGKGCAQRGPNGEPYPGAYTAIVPHLDWITAARRWADDQGVALNGQMIRFPPGREQPHG